MQDRSNVVIVGVDVKRALFPYEDPVDKEVRINGNPYRVIGVMGTTGKLLRPVARQLDLCSHNDIRQVYSGRSISEVVFFMVVRPNSRAYVKAAMDEITDILRRRRRVPLGAKNDLASPLRIHCWTSTIN